jgi:hypothetical protein
MLLVFFTLVLCLSIHPPKKYALGANLIQKGLIVQNKVQGSNFFFKKITITILICKRIYTKIATVK